jgi:hypothetical protein
MWALMPLPLQICRQETRQATKEQEEGGDEDASGDQIDVDFPAATACQDASNDSNCDEGKSKEENCRPSSWVMKPTIIRFLNDWFV